MDAASDTCTYRIRATGRLKGRVHPWLIVCFLLVVHAGLLVWSALTHSPNMNEPCHIVAGLAHWKFGRYDLYNVNPPLVRMVATLPVMILGSETDWSNWSSSARARSEFQVGPDWIAANGKRSIWLTTVARFACIPFSLVGGICCFLWARDLYGVRAGLLSCGLWCFSPNILGHASCVTPDAHAAAIGLAANYLFWRWLRVPTYTSSMSCGIMLGLAMLTKTTWIVLLPLWLFLGLVWQMLPARESVHVSRPSGIIQSLQLVIIFALAVNVLNLGYGYDGFFRPLGGYSFISSALSGQTGSVAGNRFKGTLLADVPVPLPAQFVLGADVQKQDHERHPISYFRGRTYRHGFWYFYLYALVVKVPLGTWVLAILAIYSKCIRCNRRCSWQDELVVLLPFATVLMVASVETDYTAHFRYVLPVLGLSFVWCSQVANAATMMRPIFSAISVAAMIWIPISTVSNAPHWISYFNEIAGGSANGHFHLANSNSDWGQDLLYFAEWQANHAKGEEISLAYYGMLNPIHLGIPYKSLSCSAEQVAPATTLGDSESQGSSQSFRPGWYAVSTNFLVGHPSWCYRPDGTRSWLTEGRLTWMQRLTPVDRAGYSIHIYHIKECDLERIDGISSRPERVKE